MDYFFQAEDGIRDLTVTGVQTCDLPISFTALWRRRNYTQKSSGTAVGPSRWPERRCSRPSRDGVSCWRSRSISSFVNGEKFLVIVVFCSSMARVGMPTTAVVTGKLME